MSIISLLILLIIAGICGGIGQSLAGSNSGGFLISIVVGFIGAMLGNKISQTVGMHDILTIHVGGEAFPILWSIIGATIFVVLLHLIRRT